MPRLADHEQRRAQLADAVLAVAAREGLARVSVPRVAAEAGVSVGLVQHYFPAKRGLLAAAHERSLANADRRIAALVESGEASGSTIRAMATEALAQLLPLDPARRDEAMVRAEFAALALRDATLREAATAAHRGVRDRLAVVLGNGVRCGEVPPGTDLERAAAELAAIVDGLRSALLLDAAADDVTPVLAAAVARVCPGECRADATPPGRRSARGGAPPRG